ncbi:cytochrome p450 [Rhyzopertha dominica]|nr:cytochrome p450 [Rhyzopertha dominica]
MAAVEEHMHKPLISAGVFYPLLAVCGILALIHFYQQSLHVVKLGRKLPGPFALPIVGNCLEAFRLGPNDIMKKVLYKMKDYPDVCRAFFGHKLYVALINPHDIELILGSNVHLEKSEEYRFFKPWLGDGLLISKGDKWKYHRKIIAPTFHSSILKSFVPIFNKQSRHVVNKLRKEIGKEFDVHDYMSGTTVDILLETAMGVRKGDNEDDTGFDYAMAVMKMCNILHQRHYKLWLYPDMLFKWTKMAVDQVKFLDTIHSLTRSVIKRKKAEYFQRTSAGETSLYTEFLKQNKDSILNDDVPQTKSKITGFNDGAAIRDDLDENDENDVGEKKRLAFLDFMIEASQTKGYKISEEEIKEEVDTIMFEGHDTTAAGSSFVLCVLAAHPDIQEKVVEELKEIFGDSDRLCTFADTLQMKYLERVIMETLRLYPPVPLIARKLNQDLKLVSGNYIVPKDSTVVIGTYLLHRRADLYPNPEIFDPDRFLPEKCQERHYYSYIPFSAGPRSCVGRKYAMLKLKVLLSTIIRNFKITSSSSEKDFQLQGDIILKRTDGFRISVEDRKR